MTTPETAGGRPTFVEGSPLVHYLEVHQLQRNKEMKSRSKDAADSFTKAE